jgi:type IV pilus biogenesis protein CpaD/CtpE
MIAEDNFKTLCNLTTSLMGLRKGSLAYKSRRSELQVPRAVASVVARMVDDIHPTIIAKEIKRDRVSVWHYEKMHQSNYSTWERYRECFNKIYNAYTNIQGAKRTFSDMFHLRHHLSQQGVKHSANPQTTIKITSGEVGVDIKVSYKDFYNQLELCKLALRDCNYKLEII